MQMEKKFDVIIVGGSYAGLSAALCMSRMRRQVLLIDSGNPSNKSAYSARNFLTHDGDDPENIRSLGRSELKKYPNCLQVTATAAELQGQNETFWLKTLEMGSFFGKKILFCTGVSDIMPGIAGFADCWGKSIFHCPYCHAYELPDLPIAVIASGDHARHLTSTLRPLFSHITLLTNGEEMQQHPVFVDRVIHNKIAGIQHQEGKMLSISFSGRDSLYFPHAFAKVLLKQQCDIPEKSGCTFRGHLIEIDTCQRTSIEGVFSAGDNCHLPRSISLAVAAGTRAAFQLNHELCEQGL